MILFKLYCPTGMDGYYFFFFCNSGRHRSVAFAELINVALANATPKISSSTTHLCQPDWQTSIFCQRRYGIGRCYECNDYLRKRPISLESLLNDCTMTTNSMVQQKLETEWKRRMPRPFRSLFEDSASSISNFICKECSYKQNC